MIGPEDQVHQGRVGTLREWKKCFWKTDQSLALRNLSLLQLAAQRTVYNQTGNHICRGQLKCDGTRAETRFRLSAKRTSPFKSAGASVQSTTDSRGVRISGSSEVVWRMLATHSIRQFPLHLPSRHRVPSHFNWSLQRNIQALSGNHCCSGKAIKLHILSAYLES